MQTLLQHRSSSYSSLGQRRGCSDPARFALDLSWDRAESESAPPSGDYPSPPMSGSPSLPAKITQEAGDRVQGVHQTTTTTTASQDVYRGAATTQPEPRLQQPPVPTGPVRLYPTEAVERMPYSFPRPDEPMQQRPMPSYAPPHSQIMSQHPFLPAPRPAAGPSSVPAGYAVVSRPPIHESPQPYSSPKSQRKTKGHVASACVPCKKAHLRCDAQRPCTRCLQNGKEDACIDVQHKKRGRPRLRDDRDARFDPPSSRFGHTQDPSIRRPLSLYAPQAPNLAYDDSLRRSQSYRVLKSQPAEALGPRFPERGSATDVNIFPAPLTISTRPPEAAAFLTRELEIANASSSFTDAIGRLPVQGLKITDVVAFGDRDKMLGLQRQIQDELARKEPNYLPPIYSKQEEERVIQSLGFSTEEIAKFKLERVEYLRFNDQAGQTRNFQVRMGLAKQESIYFIVVLLIMPHRSLQPPTPSPQARDPRDLPYSYPTPQQPYPQPTPVSATFDHARGRPGSEMGYLPRQPVTPGQMMPGLSPRLSSSYAASPSRPDYPAGPSAYQIPRSELTAAPRPSQPPGYHLPPIRSQQQPQQPQSSQPVVPSDQGWFRDDRQQRVDIGGLIDRPDPSQRRPQ